jgi:hypothetical protein
VEIECPLASKAIARRLLPYLYSPILAALGTHLRLQEG